MPNLDQEIFAAHWAAFVDLIDAAEGRVGLRLPQDVWDYVEQTRQLAFEAGWTAGREAALGRSSPMRIPSPQVETAKCRIPELEVGQSGWVPIHALIEDAASGQCFVDPLFVASREHAPERPIQLTRTSSGLVARGPGDLHRIAHDLSPGQFLPIIEFLKGPIG